MARVVISHQLDQSDPEAPVYRIRHGVEIKELVSVLDGDGNPVLRDNDEPEVEEQLVGYSDVNDVVFDANDDRWFKGKGRKRARRDDSDIVKEQRQILRDTFDKVAVESEHAEQARAAATTNLPGTGEVL
jgi:hypothetical protein